jgi:hypothetical protein
VGSLIVSIWQCVISVVEDPFAAHRIRSVCATLQHDHLQAVVLALPQEPRWSNRVYSSA